MEERKKFEVQRPLDFLMYNKGSRITIETKDMKVIEGKLVAFDLFINLVLEDTVEVIDEKYGKSKELDFAFIKGDNVSLIHTNLE